MLLKFQRKEIPQEDIGIPILKLSAQQSKYVRTNDYYPLFASIELSLATVVFFFFVTCAKKENNNKMWQSTEKVHNSISYIASQNELK